MPDASCQTTASCLYQWALSMPLPTPFSCQALCPKLVPHTSTVPTGPMVGDVLVVSDVLSHHNTRVFKPGQARGVQRFVGTSRAAWPTLLPPFMAVRVGEAKNPGLQSRIGDFFSHQTRQEPMANEVPLVSCDSPVLDSQEGGSSAIPTASSFQVAVVNLTSIGHRVWAGSRSDFFC